MCGIHVVRLVAGPESEAQATNAVQQMMKACGYRGPDEQGMHVHTAHGYTTVLGHNRLRLRGGTAGQQPLHIAGFGTLVYNGQLFGEDIGASDTHALAQALADGNHTFLDTHPGMAAYVWLDAHTGDLHVGRDAFGIKPLFYAQGTNSLVLSSEMRGIQASQQIVLEIDTTLAPEVLLYRCTPQQAGIYANVVAFSRGYTCMHGLDFQPFSHKKEANKKDASQNEKRGLKAALAASLEQNLMADRPVGLMLSGGVDSGLLAHLAAEAGHRLPCFTTAGPEAARAKALAERLGHGWHEVAVPRETDAWLAFLKHSPTPVADPGAYLTWCIAKAAKDADMPVLLSGAGADELFLGYRRHQFWHRYGPLLCSRLYSIAAPWLHQLNSRFPLPSHIPYPASLYRQLMAAPGSLASHLNLETPHLHNYALSQHTDSYTLDLNTYLPHQLLLATDLAAMAHGVEVRVPYLTHELQAIAQEIGTKALLKKGGKAPLKNLLLQMGGTLTPKLGFGPDTNQYPDYQEIEEALGLDALHHPIYSTLPYAKVLNWRKGKTPLQARMAFWCAGVMFHVELERSGEIEELRRWGDGI